MSQSRSLQKRFAPGNQCFGCGAANPKGLGLESFPTAESPDAEVVAQWSPEPHHAAFENILNGGIIGTLLDCHSTWTAVWHLMQRDGLDRAPACVTGDFHVKLEAPTSTERPVTISARAVASEGRKVTVEAVLRSGDRITATCSGHFIAVKPGHPAFSAW